MRGADIVIESIILIDAGLPFSAFDQKVRSSLNTLFAVPGFPFSFPVLRHDGHTVYLVQSARAASGGVAFYFLASHPRDSIHDG
jgi:hypothetical protein